MQALDEIGFGDPFLTFSVSARKRLLRTRCYWLSAGIGQRRRRAEKWGSVPGGDWRVQKLLVRRSCSGWGDISQDAWSLQVARTIEVDVVSSRTTSSSSSRGVWPAGSCFSALSAHACRR